jgi:hypothetical protein
MSDTSQQNLPPLPQLLFEIDFSVYGMASPFLGLQLRSMHYGVEEDNSHIIGLGLFYSQKYLGSPKVLAVESSLLPAKIPRDDRPAAIDWSWANLVDLLDANTRLHGTGSIDLLDDDAQEARFQAMLEEIQSQEWALLTEKSNFPLLVGMEVTRLASGAILARRFEGDSMLLCSSIGLEPEQFLDSMKQLISLREVPKAAQRHQEEFERITAV